MKRYLKLLCSEIDAVTTDAAGAEDWELQILDVLYRRLDDFYLHVEGTLPKLLADIRLSIGEKVLECIDEVEGGER